MSEFFSSFEHSSYQLVSYLSSSLIKYQNLRVKLVWLEENNGDNYLLKQALVQLIDQEAKDMQDNTSYILSPT